MNNNFEYYLIGSDNTPSVPSLQPADGTDTLFLIDESPIELPTKPMELWFRKPIPRKPKMVDFHQMPSSIFSKKIADVLCPMNIEGLQLVPATVVGNEGIEHKDYFIVYIYKKIGCLDIKHSQYDEITPDGKARNLLKFFLDNKKLAKIPLEKRLIFLLKEDRAKRIYHKSVVEAIMSVNPVGIRFYPIQEWHEGIQFDA